MLCQNWIRISKELSLTPTLCSYGTVKVSEEQSIWIETRVWINETIIWWYVNECHSVINGQMIDCNEWMHGIDANVCLNIRILLIFKY